MKKLLPLLLLSLTLPIMSSCQAVSVKSDVYLNEVLMMDERPHVEVPEDLITSVYQLSDEITPDYFEASTEANQIFSPLSLWYALGVLREGATGETLSELDQMMKLPQNFSSREVIPQLSMILNFMEQSGRTTGIKNGIRLTNGIFLDSQYRDNILDSWLDMATDVWGTEVAAVDFTDGSAVKNIIQQWVARKTNDFIPDYEPNFTTDGNTILNIYNVLYLKDQWQEPFQEIETKMFQTLDGFVHVPYFAGVHETEHWIDRENVQGAAFTGETGIKIWFLLPREDLDPVELLPKLRELLANNEPALVNFQGPKLNLDGENLSLGELLTAKGYSRLFSNAELGRMFKDIKANVGDIRQKAKLEIDHKGFQAAAVTEVSITGAAAPPDAPVDLIIDRPYLLVIEYEGLPLFIARITDPS